MKAFKQILVIAIFIAASIGFGWITYTYGDIFLKQRSFLVSASVGILAFLAFFFSIKYSSFGSDFFIEHSENRIVSTINYLGILIGLIGLRSLISSLDYSESFIKNLELILLLGTIFFILVFFSTAKKRS